VTRGSPGPGGRFFDDFRVGDTYRSARGRTVLEADNTWFTLLTMNTNQIHFNRPFAEETEFGDCLVVSTLTLAIIVGLSVADTSEYALANLGWKDIRLPAPVYAGDTLWAESEVLNIRESGSRPNCGIVEVRTRGINQRSDVVIEFVRSFLVPKRGGSGAASQFPETSEEWRVK